MRKSLTAGVVFGSVMALGAAGPAMADPPPFDEGATTTLTCDDGSVYEGVVVAPGGGSWTPAFSATDNTVFIPLEFRDFFFRVTDASTGEVYVDEVEPGIETKNAKRRGRTVVNCAFEESVLSVDDPDFGTDVIYSFGGDVTGMRTR